jgi:hypothetical protein
LDRCRQRVQDGTYRNLPVTLRTYLVERLTQEDVEDVVARLRTHGAELVGELVQYQHEQGDPGVEDSYRLCYVRLVRRLCQVFRSGAAVSYCGRPVGR